MPKDALGPSEFYTTLSFYFNQLQKTIWIVSKDAFVKKGLLELSADENFIFPAGTGISFKL